MRLTWGRRALNARAPCGPHAHASQGYVGHPWRAAGPAAPQGTEQAPSPLPHQAHTTAPSRRGRWPEPPPVIAWQRDRPQKRSGSSRSPHPTRPPARAIPSSAYTTPPPARHGRARRRASPRRHARTMEGRNGSGSASGPQQDTTDPATTPASHPARERLRTRGTPHHARCLLRPGPPTMLRVSHARARRFVLVAL